MLTEISTAKVKVKYLRNLGKVLNMAVSRKLITNSPLEELKLKIEAVDKGFLNKNELSKLATKEFEVTRLEQVRDVFPVFVMRYPNRELPTQRPADIAPAAEDPYEALSWKS